MDITPASHAPMPYRSASMGEQTQMPGKPEPKNSRPNARLMTESAQAFMNVPIANSLPPSSQLNNLYTDLNGWGIDSATINRFGFMSVISILAQNDVSVAMEFVQRYKQLIVDGMMNVSDRSPFAADRTAEQRAQDSQHLNTMITGGLAVLEIGLLYEMGNYWGACQCAWNNQSALYALAKDGLTTGIPNALYQLLIEPRYANQEPPVVNASLPALGQRLLLAPFPALAIAKSSFDQMRAAHVARIRQGVKPGLEIAA